MSPPVYHRRLMVFVDGTNLLIQLFKELGLQTHKKVKDGETKTGENTWLALASKPPVSAIALVW